MQKKNNAGSAPVAVGDDMDDAPILTDAEVGEVEVFEGDTFVRRGRGRPPTGNAKELVSLRLDREVLAKLREHGPGWQSKVNPLLREVLGLDRAPGVFGAVAEVGKHAVMSDVVGVPQPPQPPPRIKMFSDQTLPGMTEGLWIDSNGQAVPAKRQRKAKSA